MAVRYVENQMSKVCTCSKHRGIVEERISIHRGGDRSHLESQATSSYSDPSRIDRWGEEHEMSILSLEFISYPQSPLYWCHTISSTASKLPCNLCTFIVFGDVARRIPIIRRCPSAHWWTLSHPLVLLNQVHVDGSRTRDRQVKRLMLYPLSYF